MEKKNQHEYRFGNALYIIFVHFQDSASQWIMVLRRPLYAQKRVLLAVVADVAVAVAVVVVMKVTVALIVAVAVDVVVVAAAVYT